MSDVLNEVGRVISELPEPRVAIATRTLLASGYEITGAHSQPRHIEIRCERSNAIGARVAILLAVTSEDELSFNELEDLKHAAASECRSVVVVAAVGGQEQLSWGEFLDALGGAVPSWRALASSYGHALVTASQNQLPAGETGEAWRLFEDLVGDGLEFLFGKRVRRLGARRRGQTVSDMIAQLPDTALIVVDAKATASGFDASWNELRPLGEYVQRQRDRQRGQNLVFCALVVSSGFQQDDSALVDVSRRFYAENFAPIAFLSAEHLRDAVDSIRSCPQHRNAMKWRTILSGGRVVARSISNEIAAVRAERVTREES